MTRVTDELPESLEPGVPYLVVLEPGLRRPRVVRRLSTEEQEHAAAARASVEAFQAEKVMEPLQQSSEAALREFLKVTMVVAPSLTALPDDLTPLEAALRAWLSEFGPSWMSRLHC